MYEHLVVHGLYQEAGDVCIFDFDSQPCYADGMSTKCLYGPPIVRDRSWEYMMVYGT